MKPLLVILSFLAFSESAFPITFAQLALGGGYETHLFVTNTTARTWTGALWFYQGRREPWQGTLTVSAPLILMWGSNRAVFTINPNGTVPIDLRGDNSVRAGFLEIHADANTASRDEDIVVAYFYQFFSPDGKLLTTTGSGPSPYHIHFSFPVEKSSIVNTGLAWAPLDFSAKESFVITVVLLNLNGTMRQFARVPYAGHMAKFFDQILAGIGEDEAFSGSIYVDSPYQIYLEVLRMEKTDSGFLYTSTPPSACLSRPWVMP